MCKDLKEEREFAKQISGECKVRGVGLRNQRNIILIGDKVR